MSRSAVSPSIRDLARLDGRISGNVVLVGVGCAGRGDDGAGSILARRLYGRTAAAVIDGGDRPEDFTGEIARARADTVLIADVVDMGARPGDLALLEAGDVRDDRCDTHRASLETLMRYLELRTGATVLLLAIQPGVLGPGAELSGPVAAALERVQRLFGGRTHGRRFRPSGRGRTPERRREGGRRWTTSNGS